MKRSFILFFLVMALLTGCWDQKDIETRGYVLGVAIDRFPPNPQAAEIAGPNEASAAEEEILERGIDIRMKLEPHTVLQLIMRH